MKWLEGLKLFIKDQVFDLQNDVTTLKTDVSALKADVRGLDKIVSSVDGKLDKILEYFIDRPISASRSPRRLTEFELKLAEKSNADALVEKYASNVAVTKDMNEYTIQEKCFDYGQSNLIDDLSMEERNVIEKLAFDEGVDVLNMMHAVAIKLRDYKLKELGKEISDIDQLTPSENPA